MTSTPHPAVAGVRIGAIVIAAAVALGLMTAATAASTVPAPSNGPVMADRHRDGRSQDWVRAAVPVAGGRLFDSRGEEAALDRIVRGSRVVLAGEATHGTGDFFDAKVDLVTDQLERGGLTDVFLEDPVVSTRTAARFVALGEGTAREAAQSLGYDWWRTEEFVRLLTVMRRHNVQAERGGREPAFFLGMDVQGQPSDGVALLREYVAATDPRAAARVAADLACFDLDFEAADAWAARPEAERRACARDLASARDWFRAAAAALAHRPRRASDIDFHLAHAVAESLPWAERSFAVPQGDGGEPLASLEERLNVRDEGMAAVIASVFRRDRNADVVVSLHNVHGGEFRGTELPVGGGGAVRLTSTGAVLTDTLGRRAVRSLGFSFAGGTFNAYDATGEQEGIVEFTAQPPVPGSYEAEFAVAGPAGTFILPLTRGSGSLADARLLRTLIPGAYDSTRPQDTYVEVDLTSVFDGIVHYPTTRASNLLLDVEVS
jgi:erythromycin esterase